MNRMHRRFALLLFVSLVLLGPRGAASGDAASGPREAGEAIFDGKTLDGWVVEGRKTYESDGEQTPIWTVEDESIACAGKGYGFLRYDQKVCDFRLHVELKMSKGCNSGIGIRGVEFTGPAKTRPSFAGYELQILDDAGRQPGKHSSASLYRYVAPTENAMKPAPEWNTFDVECIGPHIRVWVNGQQVHDVDQSQIDQIKNKPTCGYISLQNHGKPIEFRNVRLEVLKSPEKAAQ